jgi:hypothetical protein
MTQEVKIGDFCVVPISGYVGWLISVGEWANGSGFHDYDHAEIYVGNPEGFVPLKYGYTLGAYPGGARLVGLTSEPVKVQNSLWSSGYFELTDGSRTEIVEKGLSLIGVPYSSLDYFALAAHHLHLPVPFIKSYIASTKHLICSQLVDYVYEQCGIHLFKDNRWPGYVTPADLAQLIGGKKTDD